MPEAAESSKSPSPPGVIRFGTFEVDPASGELSKNGRKIRIQQQPFQILLMLLSRPGRVVTREELRAQLWADNTFVDFEHGLNAAVKRLRDALGDSAENPQFVETLARRGYRFISTAVDARRVEVMANTSALNNEPLRGSAAKRTTLGKSLRLAAIIALVGVAMSVGWLAVRAHREHPLVVERRVTANPTEAPVVGAAISPNGRYIAYLDTTGLYLRETQGGDIHPLRLPKAFVVTPTSWFPDDASFAATWNGGPGQLPSVWKISILGSPPQKLSDNAWGASVSADGSHIAFLRGGPAPAGGGLEIWTMRSNGTDQRQITSATPGTALGPVAWSPEGKRIAYLRIQPGPVSTQESLETRDSMGLQPATVVLNDRFLGQGLCWAPDQRIIYSKLRREAPDLEDSGLWAISIHEATGNPQGQAQLLTDARKTSGVGWISDLSISRDSKHLMLVSHSIEPQVFVGELESTRPRHLQRPRRLTLDQHANVPFAWTADSKNVLFISSRNGMWNIFKQALHQPTAELFVGGEDRLFGPRLSPDGSEIFYFVMPRSGGPASEVSLMRMSMSGGPPRLVRREAGMSDVQCARLPSTRCILTQLHDDVLLVHAFDPLLEKTEPLLRLSISSNLSLSSDGSQLAIITAQKRGSVQLFSLATHQSREIMVKGWPELRNVDWSADGRSLFVPATKDERTVALLEIDTQGNAWELLQGQLGWAIPSPDSRYLAFVQAAGENNVWMIENF